MTLSPLFSQAKDMVRAALKAGATAADAVAVRGQSQSISVRDGKVEQTQSAEGDDFGLRVFVGRRVALVSANHLSENGLQNLAERAVAMARIAPEDPYAGFAPADLLYREQGSLDLCDETVVTPALLTEYALRLEAAAMQVKGVTKSGSAAASCGRSGYVLVTSEGFEKGQEISYHSLSVTAVAGEGTLMERDYDYSTAVYAADLETPEKLGQQAGERAARKINSIKIASGKMPVVFEPRVAASLVGHVLGAVNGAAVARNSSFLKDKIGEKLFRDNVTVLDDPLRMRGLASQLFDAEGVATKPLKIIENGILRSYLLDSATARELKLVATGHARRGVSSPPYPGSSNTALLAGSYNAAQLVKDIDYGLYITGLIGSGVNMITGDYSRGANGFLIEKGEITRPVSEITLAGTLPEMFALMEVGDDLVWRTSINAPTVRFGEMAVAGK